MHDEAVSLEQLIGISTGLEPEELQNYLASLKEGVPYVKGTTNRLLGSIFTQQAKDQLFLPESYTPAGISNYVVVPITADEYAPHLPELTDLERRDLCAVIAQQAGSAVPLLNMMTALALLNHLAHDPKKELSFSVEYGDLLQDISHNKFNEAMTGTRIGSRRAFLYRQAILNAIRLALNRPEPSGVDPSTLTDGYILAEATLSAHAIAGLLGPLGESSEPLVAGMSVSTFMEFNRSDLFNRRLTSHDLFAMIGRYFRLWDVYGRKLQMSRPRKRPPALLAEATGLDIDQILGLTLALYVQLTKWQPGELYWIEAKFDFSRLADETKQMYVRLISNSLEELSRQAKHQRSEWDFLMFQRSPVLRHEDRLLVLDETLLFQRVLSGLYWVVHDYENDHHGESMRRQWSQAYGEMIELLAEDQIRSMAPKVAGFGQDPTYYSEDEIRRAYGTKACDAAVHFGSGMCLFEIVSGRAKVDARVGGSFVAYENDVERVVLKKADQLNTSAMAVLANESALTGHPATPSLSIIPILVIGEEFPTNPATRLFVEEMVARRGLFKRPQIRSLAIVDLSELEMLEGLADRGYTPVQIIDAWRASRFRMHPLRNYLIDEYGARFDFRSKRLIDNCSRALDDIVDAIRMKN